MQDAAGAKQDSRTEFVQAHVAGGVPGAVGTAAVGLCFFLLGSGERRRAAQHSVGTVAARQARDGVQS